MTEDGPQQVFAVHHATADGDCDVCKTSWPCPVVVPALEALLADDGFLFE